MSVYNWNSNRNRTFLEKTTKKQKLDLPKLKFEIDYNIKVASKALKEKLGETKQFFIDPSNQGYMTTRLNEGSLLRSRNSSDQIRQSSSLTCVTSNITTSGGMRIRNTSSSRGKFHVDRRRSLLHKKSFIKCRSRDNSKNQQRIAPF